MIVLLAMLSAAAGAVPTQAKAADLRCAVALTYVRDVVKQARGPRLVFSTSEGQSLDTENGRWFEADSAFDHPKSLPAPAEHLVERLGRTKANAVRRCSSVRQFLKADGIAYGAQAVKAAATRGVFKAYIQTVTLPVVSGDRRRAVLERGEMRGSTDGGGWFELLERKPNGEWKVIGYRPLWMS
jgi:hypothetical protein